MKSYFFLQVLIVVMAIYLQACQSDSTPLVSPPRSESSVEQETVFETVEGPEAERVQETNTPVRVVFQPKLDILFVIDDSRSMEPHQINLSRNIDRFVEGFSKERFIDFHIGVTGIWDSRRYGPVVKKWNRQGEKNFDDLGELKIVKGLSEDNEVRYLSGQRSIET